MYIGTSSSRFCTYAQKDPSARQREIFAHKKKPGTKMYIGTSSSRFCTYAQKDPLPENEKTPSG